MAVRPIDANAFAVVVALYMAENAYLNDTALDALKKVAKWLDEEPTLDYAPVRHEEWKRTEVSRCGEMHTLYVCSGCNDYIGFREDPGEYTVLGNYLYCRICGAKMDGKAEPIRNRWLMRDDGEGLRRVCSHCGNESKQETPFCAQCGARMDGGEEHE